MGEWCRFQDTHVFSISFPVHRCLTFWNSSHVCGKWSRMINALLESWRSISFEIDVVPNCIASFDGKCFVCRCSEGATSVVDFHSTKSFLCQPSSSRWDWPSSKDLKQNSDVDCSLFWLVDIECLIIVTVIVVTPFWVPVMTNVLPVTIVYIVVEDLGKDILR